MINMSRLCFPLLCFPLLGLPLLVATAATPARAQSFVQDMDKRFAQRTPKAGELLPNAIGFDAQGKPFALDQTRGKLTVLVTGCLT